MTTNGQYLTLTGYNTTPGSSSNLAATSVATVQRSVAIVDQTGAIDSITSIALGGSGSPIGAVTSNGTSLWVLPRASTLVSLTAGAPSSAAPVATGANLGGVNIFGGQLYVSTPSAQVATVGTGLPTTSASIIGLTGLPASVGTEDQYFFANLSGGSGYDTLYVADPGSGLTKYTLSAGVWRASGTVGSASDTYRGLTGVVSAGTVTLYATRDGGAQLVSLVDRSGSGGTFSAVPTVLATAPPNEAFRGVALAPTAPAPVATQTALASPSASASGQSVTFTATVTSGSGTPTGSVTFSDGGTTIGSGSLNGNGVAAFSTSALGLGAHTIRASYAGSGNFTASASNGLTLTVGSPVTPTIVLTSSASPASDVSALALTATLTGPYGGPSGAVNFYDGAALLGTANLSGGVATFDINPSVSGLTDGTHTISAVYGGDIAYLPVTSALLSQTIQPPLPSATALAGSAAHVAGGQAATFAVTVTSPDGTPAGTVTLYDDQTSPTVLGTAPLVNGTATFSGITLADGVHPLDARFDGGALFTPSDGSTIVTFGGYPFDLSAPAALFTAAGSPLVLSAAGQNGIGLTDIDPAGTPITVALAAADGTLSLAGTSNLTLTAGTGTNDTAVTFTGTAAAVDAALSTLTYTPDSGFAGSDALTISATDAVTTAAGTGAVTETVAIGVGQPTVAVASGTQQAASGAATFLSGSGGSAPITVGDAAPADTPLTVTLGVTNGTLALGLDPAAVVAGSGTASVTLTGTAADINNALGLVSYTSNLGYTGPDTLTVRVDDPGTLAAGIDTATASLGISVDTPTLTVPPAESTYTTGTLTFATGSGNAITVGDSAGAATPLTVTLSVTGGTLTLAQTSNLTFVAGTGAGDTLVTVTGLAGDINAALDGLTYTPSAGRGGTDAITITVDDPSTLAAGSGTASAVIDLALNTPPVVTVPDAQATQTSSALVFSAEGGDPITLAYPTTDDAPLTVSLSVAQGTISLAEDANLTFPQGTGTDDTAETFTGTPADINSALDGLTYTPADGYYGADALPISGFDPAVTGGSQNPTTASVALTVQTVPFASVPDDQSATENQALTLSSANGNAITVGDSGASTTILTVTLSVGNGTLALAQTTGLTITAGTATESASITFTGLASDINSALDGLVYTPAADFTGTDTLNVSADDPQSAANGQTDSEQVSIAVAAPTTAPTSVTISDPGVSTTPLVTDDQTPLALSSDDGSNIVIAEPDPSATLTVTLSAINGTLALGQTDNLTFTQGTGTGDAAMTFTGTQADVDAALDGLTYTPNSTFTGTDTIAVSVNGTATMSIPVTVTYPAPTVTVPDALTVNADTPVTLSAAASSAAGIASVQWSFDDAGEGPVVDPTLTTLTPTYTFPHYGQYDVTVTVTANDGQVGSADFPVTVAEVAPTAAVTDSGPVTAGQSETFTVQESDPDALDDVTVLADWTGSGTFEQVDPSQMTVNPDGTLSFTHEYDDTPAGGTDQAVIKVVDDGGQASTSTVPVTVTSTLPSGTLGFAPLDDSTPSTPNTTRYVDPNGNPMFALAAGTPFVFTGVTDPSPADSGGLTYHWTVTINPLQAGATSTTTTTTDPQFELPGANYDDGTMLQVTGWISYTAANQQVVASAPQTVYTFVVPPTSGNDYPAIFEAERQELHGTVLPVGMSAPAEYNPYLITGQFPPGVPVTLTGVSVPADIAAGQSVAIQFQLDPASLAQATAAAPIWYAALVRVYNTSAYSITDAVIQTFEVVSRTPTLTLGAFPSDRQVAITAYAFTSSTGQAVLADLTSPAYGLTLTTPRTQPIWNQFAGAIDDVVSAASLVQNLATQFGAAGTAIVNAIGASPSTFLTNLTNGLTGAVGTFISGLPDQIQTAGLTWLGLQNLPNIQSITGPNALTSFLLQYSGLTWGNVQSVLMQGLGSNAAAVNTVAGWISKYNTADPASLITFLESGAIPGLNMDTVRQQMDTAFDTILKQVVTSAVQSLVAKFAPGAGVVGALYQGFNWVLTNQAQLSAVITQFINTLNELASDPDQFEKDLVKVMNLSLPTLIGFAASQLGLGNLPGTIQKALQFIPTQVNKALAAGVQAVIKRLPLSGGGSSTNDLYAGLLSPAVAFTYQGTQYQLWVAKANGKGVVKVAKVVSGKPQFLKVLTAADFTNSTVTTAKADIGALITAAGAAATAATLPKAPAKPSASQLAAAQNAAQPLPGAEQQVIKDILANACAALNAGCFAAGSMIWTPDGYRAVEDIMPGDRVWARSEFDPSGPIEAKVVEAKFVRLGRILHLHFPHGELIRTTPEHPFWVEGRGWTAAGALAAGDRVATRSGEWVPLAEVFDTEQWETVYNVRVAEYHTYFVGEERWGWAAWAHNAYEQQVASGDVSALPQAVRDVIARAAAARAQREKSVAQPHSPGTYIPTRFAGNYFVVQAVTSSGVQTHVEYGTSPSRNHSEVAMLRWFQTAGVTSVIAAFTEHVPCTSCSLGPVPAMRKIAGNFTIYWGVNVGQDDEASNQALADWWMSTGIYTGH